MGFCVKTNICWQTWTAIGTARADWKAMADMALNQSKLSICFELQIELKLSVGERSAVETKAYR